MEEEEAAGIAARLKAEKLACILDEMEPDEVAEALAAETRQSVILNRPACAWKMRSGRACQPLNLEYNKTQHGNARWLRFAQ